jgi:hypothetical protein
MILVERSARSRARGAATLPASPRAARGLGMRAIQAVRDCAAVSERWVGAFDARVAALPARAGRWIARLPLPTWARRLEGRLPQPTLDWGIALVAAVLSVVAYIYYAQRGLTLAYNDSISHMEIARRVLISSAPGLAQLGSVWPPLTHILMLPFIWIDPLYRSGLAGSLPSMAAYVVGAVYMYRLAALCCSSRGAGAIAALALMLNPSVLYMQSTPMTEIPLVCCAIIAIFYAVRWAHDFVALDLAKGAAAVAAGTLIRYDAWALALTLAAFVGAVAWRRHGWRFAEASGIVFAVLGFAGCAAWFLYNAVIFGSALYFASGPYSASAQQRILQAHGLLGAQGNPLLALQAYGFATLDTAGLLVTAAAVVGALVWIVRRRLDTATVPTYALLIPFAFNWLALVVGASSLDTGELNIAGVQTFFNGRYGLMMLPAVAFFVAVLAARHRLLRAATLLLIVLFGVGGTLLATPYALQDPLHGVNAQGRAASIEQSAWISAHIHSGNVLISYGSFAPVIFLSKLPEQRLVTDSDGPAFRAALADPAAHVQWIVMDANSAEYDPVWQALSARQDWTQDFTLQQRIGSVLIYGPSGLVDPAAPTSQMPAPSGASATPAATPTQTHAQASRIALRHQAQHDQRLLLLV